MNLLNLLKYQLGSNLTEQLSNFLGEKPQLVQSALDATLPSVLSVFVRKASEKTGANDIMDTIKLGNHDGSMLNYLTGLFSGGSSTNSLMSSGDVLANKFLGNKKSVLIDAIGQYSGMKKEASGSLIKMTMPLVLGVIGKQVKNQNMDVNGLMNLLSSQKGHIGAAIPSGFTIGNYSNKQPVVEKPKPSPVVKTTTTTTKKTLNETLSKQQLETAKKVDATIATTPITTPQPLVTKNQTPAILRFLPFILGGFVLFSLLFFGIRSCSQKKAAATAKKKTTTPVVKNDAKNSTDTKAIVEAETEASYTDESSNDTSSSNYETLSPSASPGELKQKLTDAVSQGSGTSVTMDGLQFRSSNSVIRSNSRHMIAELAEVMNSNPSMRIKLESSKLANAVSVKKGLMDAGINRNRIETTNGGGSVVQLSLL